MVEEKRGITTQQLSNEAHYALWFACLIVMPEEKLTTGETYAHAWARLNYQMVERSRMVGARLMSDWDRKQALMKGLVQLMDLKLVTCVRDGAGDWLPISVTADALVVTEGKGLITHDFN